jgi:hypothetical protein
MKGRNNDCRSVSKHTDPEPQDRQRRMMTILSPPDKQQDVAAQGLQGKIAPA